MNKIPICPNVCAIPNLISIPRLSTPPRARLIVGSITTSGACLILAACSTIKSAQQLETNPKSFKYSFETPLNYQKAYRILAERSRACLQGASVGNERRTEEHLDTDKKLGEVQYINHNAFWGDDFFGYYTVKPVDETHAVITVYHPTTAIGHWDDQTAVKGWMAGGTRCSL